MVNRIECCRKNELHQGSDFTTIDDLQYVGHDITRGTARLQTHSPTWTAETPESTEIIFVCRYVSAT